MPIVVVAVDPDGEVAAVLDGSPAVLTERPGSDERSAHRAGALTAAATVQETSAVLLWPGHMSWVDPETITSLIEAHGRDAAAIVRPIYESEAGWPALLPADRVEAALAGGSDSDEVLAVVAEEVVLRDLGDPGSVMGREVDLDDLPPYEGPPEPVGGPPPEWGVAAADTPEPEATD
jgi:CTP:molybdopterin cytidylyltransferase MocA